MHNYSIQANSVVAYSEFLPVLKDLSKVSNGEIIQIGNYLYEPIDITKLKDKIESELEQGRYF